MIKNSFKPISHSINWLQKGNPWVTKSEWIGVIMFLLMYILMLNAINMTLQRWGRISLGFLSTKIHKVNQSIHKNIPKFLVRQEQGEYYGEKKLYICIWKTIMHEFMDGYKTFIIICSILRLWNTNKLQKILISFVYLKLSVVYILP